jgi:hypothetical protein
MRRKRPAVSMLRAFVFHSFVFFESAKLPWEDRHVPKQIAKRRTSDLSSFLRGQRPRLIVILLDRRDDFHLLPVVRNFFSAIQANHIRAGNVARSAPQTGAHGNREAIVGVPASEERINKSRYHNLRPLAPGARFVRPPSMNLAIT